MDALSQLYASGGNQIPEIPWMNGEEADRHFLTCLREEDEFHARGIGIKIPKYTKLVVN